MLDQLPAEVVHQVLGYLPILSSIISVSQTNRKLRDIVASGEHAIYRAFVERQFPTIKAEPPWRQTATRLTSRSRAWDRRAFIAQECVHPLREGNQTHQPGPARHASRGQTFGFMPVIDSYEKISSEGSPAREVLAFGAGGRLQVRVRTTGDKEYAWSSFKFQDDHKPEYDILDLRILRPHQNRNTQGESIFIRRANRELALLHCDVQQDSWTIVTSYWIEPEIAIDCVAVAEDAEPLIAVCNSDSIRLFPLHTDEVRQQPEHVVPLADTDTPKQRKRCATFLRNSRIAIAPQYIEGRQAASIDIFDIRPSNLSSEPIYAQQRLEASRSGNSAAGRIGANVLTKVDSTTNTDGYDRELLLSGWSDGVVRLHDLKLRSSPIREFSDPVDDGQIFSLLPVGQERFLAGSHQNGCLKTFDMRMNGRVYDHTKPLFDSVLTKSTADGQTAHPYKAKVLLTPRPSRDINIFLALALSHAEPWQPLARMQQLAERSRASRYRGSIYSLSSPSPSSPTVFVGIENHVIEMSFQSTDDILADRVDMFDRRLDQQAILNLSCYERPRRGHESTDAVLLRKQRDLRDCVDDIPPEWSQRAPGWDERWHMEHQQARGSRRASWRGRSGAQPLKTQNLAHRRR